MSTKKTFTAILVGIMVLTVALTGCGRKRNYAQCVDQFNNIVDPAQCQLYNSQYASHIGDPLWINAIPYHYATGGRMNGLTYVGGSSVPVYQPLPRGYAYTSQKQYTKTYTKVKHTPPTTIKTTPTTRPTASKTTPSKSTPSPATKTTSGSTGTGTKTPTKTKTTTKKTTSH